LAPFNELGSQNQASGGGTLGSVDLNPKDGSQDFGDQNTDSLGNFIVMRSSGTFIDRAFRVFPDGAEFLVGSFSWTVQTVGNCGGTYLNFYPRTDAQGLVAPSALFAFVDGNAVDADSGGLFSGEPIFVGVLEPCPEPSSAAMIGLGVGLMARVRRREAIALAGKASGTRSPGATIWRRSAA
jgi:hypothetical protein